MSAMNPVLTMYDPSALRAVRCVHRQEGSIHPPCCNSVACVTGRAARGRAVMASLCWSWGAAALLGCVVARVGPAVSAAVLSRGHHSSSMRLSLWASRITYVFLLRVPAGSPETPGEFRENVFETGADEEVGVLEVRGACGLIEVADGRSRLLGSCWGYGWYACTLVQGEQRVSGGGGLWRRLFRSPGSSRLAFPPVGLSSCAHAPPGGWRVKGRTDTRPMHPPLRHLTVPWIVAGGLPEAFLAAPSPEVHLV